ncbi:MAG TPA: VWA domain-containing protein [Tepidisphaeraceae bacterium]|nr:VWA domain-containing protein [Tepidisphaeraceae bacterium]
MACAVPMAVHAAPLPAIIASADTQGHLEACQSCPGGAGMGGLARRATVLAGARAQNPNLLLVDAGNALFGGESGYSGGKAIVAAYEALGYDAINISYRDFRQGKAATLALLNGSKLGAVSANMLDAATGKPLFEPFIIKRAGAMRVAVIGVSESPAGLALLPELQEQLKGISIAPPVAALAQWLPQAKTQSDRIVLLYYGSAIGLAPIRDKFPADFAAIVVGGSPAGQFHAAPGVAALLAPLAHGRDLVQCGLEAGAMPSSVPVTAETAEDPKLKQLVAGYLPAIQSARTGDAPAPKVGGNPPALPTPLAGSVVPPQPATRPSGSSAIAATAPHPAAASGPAAMPPSPAVTPPVTGVIPPVPAVAPPAPVVTPPATVVIPPAPTVAPPAPAVSPPATGVIPPAPTVAPPAPAVAPPAIAAAPAGPHAGSPRVAAKQNRKPLGLEGVGLTAQQVNAAIDTGSAALWAYVKAKNLKDHASFGDPAEDILCALALVHADAHHKFADFDTALRKYLDNIEPRKLGVYRAGVLAMLVEGYGDARYIPKLREAARYLLESQGPAGCWVYTPIIPDAIFDKTLEKGAIVHVEGGRALDQPPQSWTRLEPWTLGADGDNSVTQYALLGLNSASQLGMKMPAETWQRALKTARARQNEDGGWGYENAPSGSYGSMSCAGICAIALARYELAEKDPFVDPGIERGLGWLSKNLQVETHAKNGDPEAWYFYYMYSLERVGRILDTEFIGENEWYPRGAAALIKRQEPGGLWKGRSGQEVDPRLAGSFALLFLTRATPLIDQSPKRGGSGTLIAVATPPPNRLYIILDASGSMLDMMDGQMKFDVARDAVWAMVQDLPDSSQVALRVYGHRKRSIEKDADLDTELLIPMGPLNKPDFQAKLKPLRSRGKTPLALSLEQSLNDIGGESDVKHPLTLVLLTDGGEDTYPRRDPVKAAAALKARRDIRFHIVGFDINEADWSQQLAAMAKASGGSYWPAAKAVDLNRNLKAAVLGTPEGFDLLDASGKMIARAAFGQKLTLPEGQYTFRTALAGHSFLQRLWINTDASTSVEFDGEAALESLAAAPPAALPITGAAPASTPQATAPGTPATAYPKFCTHCGAPLKPGQKFCSHCGEKVGN